MNFCTTGIKEYWANDNLLLAGKWCEINNEEFLINKNYEILEYPWNDRDSLYMAYLKTNKKYVKVLKALKLFLNDYNKTNYSIKYWEILIGIWLKFFLHTLYDRYTIINQAASKYIDLQTFVGLDQLIVPADFDEWFNLSICNQYYNFILFSQIVRNIETTISLKKITIANCSFDINTNEINNRDHHNLTLLLKKLFPVLSKKNKVFIFKSNYPIIHEIKNSIKSKTFPCYYMDDIKYPRITKLDQETRMGLLSIEKSDSFDSLISKIILRFIPKSYLEHHKIIEKHISKSFRTNPKIIVSGNSFIGNDRFKALAAYNYENGSKLVVHQHGGQYGASKFYPLEEHEKSIADKYITWGWKDNKKNVTAGNTLILPPKKFQNKQSNKFLIGSVSSPPFTKYFYSAALSQQIMIEFEMLISMISQIKPEIRNYIYYRLKNDYGWSENKKISARFPEINIEKPSDISFTKSLLNSKIFLSTYNATIFLESFINNIPTLLFWKKEYHELRDSAIKNYIMLEKVGILHYDYSSAANHINNIYKNPYHWWNKKEVQSAKNNFCDYYANQTDYSTIDYRKYFNEN